MPHPARVLAHADVRRLIRHVGSHRHASRDHVIILLSFKAGLRACEIAGLDWTMVLRPGGGVAPQLLIAGSIAKNGNARTIPCHRDLQTALRRLHEEQRRPRIGPVIRSERGSHMRAQSIVNWFAATYAALGLVVLVSRLIAPNPKVTATAPARPVVEAALPEEPLRRAA